MPPLSPRSSRDPRVLVTGRDNLRILVLGVLGVIALSGFLFVNRYTQRSEDRDQIDRVEVDPELAAKIAKEREAATATVTEVRSDLSQRFEGVEKIERSLSAEQDAAIADLAGRLSRVSSSAMQWIEREPVARLFDESLPSSRRGQLYELHGTLVGDTWSRPVGGATTVVGLLRPEIELGRQADQPVAFVVRNLITGSSSGEDDASSPEVWRDGTWVRLRGLYVCDYSFWGRLATGGTAPFLVAGELTTSKPSSPLRTELSAAELNASFEYLDVYFPTRHNDRQPVREGRPMGVQDDVFLTFAQLVLAHEGEPFDESAELLFKEMTDRFYDDPQAERGKRFRIQGEVRILEEQLVGSNPFRIERKQFLFVGGRYGFLWVESPLIFDVKVGDVVDIEAYFASLLWYSGREGDLHKPYFVARAVRPFQPQESAGAEFWTYLLPVLMGSTIALFAFFFYLLFRDRKRSELAQAQLIEMRRRRRARQSDQPVSRA